MSVRCGNHGRDKVNHESVQDVRDCYAAAAVKPMSPVALHLTNAHRTSPVLVGAGNRPAPAWAANPATEKQLNYLDTLIAQRDWRDIDMDMTVTETIMNRIDRNTIGFREASDAITALKACPWREAERPATTAEPDVADGHYAVQPANKSMLGFYRVRTGDNGHRYLDEYASDMRHPVRGAYRAAVLAAIAADPDAGPRYGREIGRCYMCHRKLTDATSRALGIGPDCRSK
jgi:hypothetical protein